VLPDLYRMGDYLILERGDWARVCKLVRDVVGGVLQPVPISPGWLSPNVTLLANSIYSESAFENLPILGDALEEAGCDSTSLLSHLRSGGTHVRGCWALDALGKS
jgi:hypothetical protein